MSTRCRGKNIGPTAEKFYIHLKLKTGKEKMSKEWLLYKLLLCKLFMVLFLKLLTLESVCKSVGNQFYPECNAYILIQRQLGLFHGSAVLLPWISHLGVEKGRRELFLLICLLPRTDFKRYLLSPWLKSV